MITEITNAIMRMDTGQTSFDMRQIQNRRFMYQPQTGTLILGYQYKGSGVVSSHADEHDKSGATEPYDSFIRGWIGTGKQYPNGVIHFAPGIPPDHAEAFDKAFSTLQMFSENGATANTVVRGFGNVWEQPISNFIIPNEERNDKRPMPYTSYDHDKLETADTMRIERHIYFDARTGTLPLMRPCRWNSYTLCARKARQRNRRFLTTSKDVPPHGRNRRERRFCLTKRLNTQGQPLCSTLLTSGRKANMTDIPAVTGYIR